MMETITERDHLSELSSALSCYLSLLSSVADCLGQASPEVGGPYRKRIAQLRTRLFFQSTPKTIKTSLKTVEGELNDYAVVAAQHMDQHDLELRRAIVTLEHVIDTLATRHDFHGTQLREMAERIESLAPGQPAPSNEVAGELRRCVDRMGQETASMLDRARKEMAAADPRLRPSRLVIRRLAQLPREIVDKCRRRGRAAGVRCAKARGDLHRRGVIAGRGPRRPPVGDERPHEASKTSISFRHMQLLWPRRDAARAAAAPWRWPRSRPWLRRSHESSIRAGT